MIWLHLLPSFLAIAVGISAILVEIDNEKTLKEWQKLYDESE